jgi:hypothetical protein
MNSGQGSTISPRRSSSSGRSATVKVLGGTDADSHTPCGSANRAVQEGGSTIDALVDLPAICIAPIVFGTDGTGVPPGAWFATTGTG